MSNKNEVLFLSPFDFVEKGIQVILKTPSYYADNGWKVHFIVVRDTSAHGSYYYENLITPKNFQTTRHEMFESKFLNKLCQGQLLKAIYSKLRSYLAIVQLAIHGAKALNENQNIKVLYGYGPVGTLACYLLKLFHPGRPLKVISRYFGITGTDALLASFPKRVLNWDVLLSLSLPVDACIITNDGTEGDKLLNKLFPSRMSQLHFWVNGVEEKPTIAESEYQKVIEKFSLQNKKMVLSVSRLAYWKRVDRSIQVISTIVKKHPETTLRLLILGDGADKERLQALTKELGIEEYIIFVGAVSNKEIGAYYKLADFFISTYDLSNVGNPLLEAIRFNKIIFTLNNGDTSRWIKHKKNGFIYDIDETFIERMAEDLYKSSNEKQFIESIQSEIIRTEKEMLWTWDERLRAELNLANTLVGK